MKRRYTIKETMACWVTWTRVVEADDEYTAVDMFFNGEGEPVGEPDIGDCIDYIECPLEVIEGEPQ